MVMLNAMIMMGCLRANELLARGCWVVRDYLGTFIVARTCWLYCSLIDSTLAKAISLQEALS